MSEILDLSEIRKGIDALDNQIVELYKQRTELTGLVAKSKKQTSKPVRDNAREEAIIARLTEGMNDLDASSVALLYNTIFEISRARQSAYLAEQNGISGKVAESIKNASKAKHEFPKAPVVACQGVEGAYSQIACNTLFPDATIMYFENFESVFKSVKSGLCKYGVLPFENSIHGSVTEVYDMLSQTDVSVVSSVKLPIHHALLAKKGVELGEITEVYSHKQAIGQCSDFLNVNKKIKINICENTAVAARMVSNSNRRDIAAISSIKCAELYDLKILKRDLQNSSTNFTMFYCISNELEIHEGANKAAFMFNIPNRTGALFNILARFATIGVNLTKIESRPISGKDFEFMFYAEADTNGLDDKLINLFSEFETNLDFFKFIGSYKEIIPQS